MDEEERREKRNKKDENAFLCNGNGADRRRWRIKRKDGKQKVRLGCKG